MIFWAYILGSIEMGLIIVILQWNGCKKHTDLLNYQTHCMLYATHLVSMLHPEPAWIDASGVLKYTSSTYAIIFFCQIYEAEVWKCSFVFWWPCHTLVFSLGELPIYRSRALKRSQLIHAPEMNNYQQGHYWLHLSLCLCWCNGGNIEPFIEFTMCKNGKNVMSSITLITLRNNATVTEVALFAKTKIRSFRSITLHYNIVRHVHAVTSIALS